MNGLSIIVSGLGLGGVCSIVASVMHTLAVFDGSCDLVLGLGASDSCTVGEFILRTDGLVGYMFF